MEKILEKEEKNKGGKEEGRKEGKRKEGMRVNMIIKTCITLPMPPPPPPPPNFPISTSKA